MSKKFLFLSLLILTLCSSAVLGKDNFNADFDSGSVQITSDDPSTFHYFTANNDAEQNILKSVSGDYTVLYLPSKNIPTTNNGSNGGLTFENGKLVTFNKSGEVVETIPLGYARFRFAISSDQQKALIIFRSVETSPKFEAIYYDCSNHALKKLPLDGINNILDIKFSKSEDEAYLLALDSEKNHVLLTVNLSDFSKISTFNMGFMPLPVNSSSPNELASQLFVLNDRQLVVLNYGGNPIIKDRFTDNSRLPGVVSLIDIKSNTIEAKTELLFESYSQWLPMHNQLFIASRSLGGKPSSDFDDAEYSGTGRFVTVDATGIKSIDTPAWIDYQYHDNSNEVYYLTFDELGTHSFSNNESNRWKVGRNTYSQRESYTILKTSFDYLWVPNDEKVGWTWNLKSGYIKIIDLHNGKNLGRFKGMTFTKKALDRKDGKTLIAINADHTRFYILQKQQIQVLNDSFKEVKKINIPETPLGMYQIVSNELQTIVVTQSKIYRIKDDQLSPIYDFKGKSLEVYLLQEGKNINILTDKEWVVYEASRGSVTPIKPLKALDDSLLINKSHHREFVIEFSRR